MKKYFVLLLFVSLFFTANSAWASNDDKKDKVEAAAKKADAPKEAAKPTCAAGKTSCCAEKKTETKTSCCAEKKPSTQAACTNKKAANDTKSSGKKTN